MVRFAVLLLLAGLLAACGFQPRGALPIPADLGPVRVETSDPYSPLAQELARALTRAGAEAASEDATSPARLRVISESWGTRPLSVDERAQVREYATLYRVEFELVGADGKERVPRQSVELSRDYVYDNLASAGTPAEQALVQEELRRDMTAAVLRRLDAALRPAQ